MPAARKTTTTTAPDPQMTVHQAILAVKRRVGAIRKEQENKDQHYSFRGIDAVVNACHEALIETGVQITPVLMDVQREVKQTGRGTNMNYAYVIVAYEFTGPAGDSTVAVTPGEAWDIQDKASSKAMSVAFRTCLIQILQIPTDEPDPDAGMDEQIKAQQPDSEPIVDPRIAELQEEIKAIWAGMWQWDVEAVAAYYTQTMGGNLFAAGAEHLEKFRDKVQAAVDSAVEQARGAAAEKHGKGF